MLVTPTGPYPAFGIGEKADDPLAMYLADVLVGPAALAGIPGISIPAGNTEAGLPVGLQVMGPRLGDGLVLSAAHAIESLIASH